MSKKEENEFDVLFNGVSMGTGFLSGLYFTIGFDPIEAFFNVSTQLIINIAPNSIFLPQFRALAWLPTLATIVVIILTHKIYKWLGIVSVFLALISGLIVLHDPYGGFFLILASYVTAWFAVTYRKKIII